MMKALILSGLLVTALTATSFGRIGEDEKQIAARYGEPGKDLGNRGSIHQVGYMSDGFLILVSFQNGVSRRESFANPDTSALAPEAIQKILALSAPEGTKWQEGAADAGDKAWSRSDNKAVAIFPAAGKFVFIQDPAFVQSTE